MSSKTNHFVTVLVFLFLIIPFVTSADAESSHPHIVVIMVDDMGYGDPGSYNANSKIPMPYFDSLARDGMRFTDAHAPGPLCHLSRYGLSLIHISEPTRLGMLSYAVYSMKK